MANWSVVSQLAREELVPDEKIQGLLAICTLADANSTVATSIYAVISRAIAARDFVARREPFIASSSLYSSRSLLISVPFTIFQYSCLRPNQTTLANLVGSVLLKREPSLQQA